MELSDIKADTFWEIYFTCSETFYMNADIYLFIGKVNCGAIPEKLWMGKVYIWI